LDIGITEIALKNINTAVKGMEGLVNLILATDETSCDSSTLEELFTILCTTTNLIKLDLILPSKKSLPKKIFSDLIILMAKLAGLRQFKVHLNIDDVPEEQLISFAKNIRAFQGLSVLAINFSEPSNLSPQVLDTLGISLLELKRLEELQISLQQAKESVLSKFMNIFSSQKREPDSFHNLFRYISRIESLRNLSIHIKECSIFGKNSITEMEKELYLLTKLKKFELRIDEIPDITSSEIETLMLEMRHLRNLDCLFLWIVMNWRVQLTEIAHLEPKFLSCMPHLCPCNYFVGIRAGNPNNQAFG